MARKLEGGERGLDAIVGLVVLVAGLTIGVISLFALYEFGINPPAGVSGDAVNIGFTIAFYGSIIVYGIAILVYLARIAIGRRSWTAPLWGTAIMTILLVASYFIMASGS
jgi:hypothetical protein